MEAVFIRHGEPDYSPVADMRGHIRDLAPLTAAGRQQAFMVAADDRLDGCEIIVSSPYARALQTAAIISSIRGWNGVEVKFDLHEWMPGHDYNAEIALNAAYECNAFGGVRAGHDCQYEWEETATIIERIERVLAAYERAGYNKIAVACHAVAMRAACRVEDDFEYCGIAETIVEGGHIVDVRERRQRDSRGTISYDEKERVVS